VWQIAKSSKESTGYNNPINPTQATHPKPLQHITRVEYVRFVGFSWSFCPGVGPYFFPGYSYYLPGNFEGFSIKAG
jgi:hypothetical protein